MIGLSLLAVLVIADSRTVAQAAAPQQRTTLLVDFRALDADGNPVMDLRPADLTLRASADGRHS